MTKDFDDLHRFNEEEKKKKEHKMTFYGNSSLSLMLVRFLIHFYIKTDLM